jgi:hypothetical protein
MATNIESLPVGIYMQSGSGAPTHISPKGTEYTDLDTAIVYINKDGVATWVEFLDSTFVFTGGTVSGATFFSGGISATTFSATTYLGLPLDIHTTGFTFNPATYDITIKGNDGVNYSQNLGILATDMTITGGTYNINTGVVTFTNNTGGTFSVTGFTSGMTDSYTTSANLSGETIQFNNNLQGPNFYNVSLTPLLSNKFNISGGTVSGSTNFTNGLTANIFSATTYQNLPTSYVGLTAGTISATTIFSPTLDNLFYDEFMTNQYAYFLPSDGTTTYSGLRTAGGTILSTGTIASLVENPMGILFTTPIAVGSVAAQYGNVFGISSLGVNFQFETIRKFRINTNNGAQRLFVGISSLYSTSAPTNVDPLTLINSIGVAKLQSGGTLNFVWNDATGTASYLDLGPSFLGTATTVTYKLKISKTFGVAAINLELTQITNSTGAVLVTGTTITSDYNSGVSYYPVAWMGNNTGVSGAVSFKDYGCQLFKRNAISS